MLRSIYKLTFIWIVTIFLPLSVLAQSQSGTLSTTRKLLGSVKSIISTLIPIAFGLAVLLFFWGIVKFIWSEGSGKEEGKKIMLWGVVAIFVMSSIWGLVAFIGGTLGLDNETNANLPTINGRGGGGSSGCAGEPGTPDCP